MRCHRVAKKAFVHAAFDRRLLKVKRIGMHHARHRRHHIFSAQSLRVLSQHAYQRARKSPVHLSIFRIPRFHRRLRWTSGR